MRCKVSYRFMRVIVFFDLPTITLEDKRNYRQFRKHLIKNGFIMLQESVYCKMALNQSIVRSISENLKKNKPASGLVQVLCITEKQFTKMEFISGEFHSEVLDTDERLVIL